MHPIGGIQPFSHGYAANVTPEREMVSMKSIRIEKPKTRQPRDLEPILPLDPRDPDVVRVKRGAAWRFANRRWVA